MTRDAWVETQYHRRLRRTWGISLGGIGFLAAGLWILSLLGAFHLAENPGDTLRVRLGSPDGEALPLAVTPLPDPAFSASTAWEDSPAAVQEKTARNPIIPEPEKKTPAKPVPEKKTPAPAKPETPAQATPEPVQAKTTEPPGPTVKVIQGRENGNTLEMVLETGTGHVGRSLYVPIYLYLPIPTALDPWTVDKIPDTKEGYGAPQTRRDLVTQFYQKEGGQWVLKAQPAYEQRPQVWIALQTAGYDLASAPYKKAFQLTPVTLKFTLSAPEAGKPSQLVRVSLESSSGNPEVDNSVIYGFRMSAFANGTGKEAQGTFTYDFRGK